MYQRRYNLPIVALTSLTLVVFFVLSSFFINRQKTVATSISVSQDKESYDFKKASDNLVFEKEYQWSLEEENFKVFFPQGEGDLKYYLEEVGDFENEAGEVRSVSGSFRLGLRESGNEIESFSQPIVICQSYKHDELNGFHPETLGLYYWDEGLQEWVGLATEVDQEGRYAIAKTEEIGVFSLRALPVK